MPNELRVKDAGWDADRAAMSPALVGRFAPSPTGRMHAGNIFASLVSYIVARRSGGHVVLRIEDLDPERSRKHYIDAILRDYDLLGLEWEGDVVYQSERGDAYEEAFQRIREQARVYECYCTRADLHAASAPHRGEKAVYPGTCRNLTAEERAAREASGRPGAIRVQVPSVKVELEDLFQGHYEQVLSQDCGDFILKRNDGAFAYQLAVVVDDAAQGVTSVVRGVDLLSSTPQQMYLQRLLNLPIPAYGHIPLLVAEKDRRLSKRDVDAGLEELLARFGTAERILGHIAHVAGMVDEEAPLSAEELVRYADLGPLARRIQIQYANPADGEMALA